MGSMLILVIYRVFSPPLPQHCHLSILQNGRAAKREKCSENLRQADKKELNKKITANHLKCDKVRVYELED